MYPTAICFAHLGVDQPLDQPYHSLPVGEWQMEPKLRLVSVFEEPSIGS